jgi:hypothetical protein
MDDINKNIYICEFQMSVGICAQDHPVAHRTRQATYEKIQDKDNSRKAQHCKTSNND